MAGHLSISNPSSHPAWAWTLLWLCHQAVPGDLTRTANKGEALP